MTTARTTPATRLTFPGRSPLSAAETTNLLDDWSEQRARAHRERAAVFVESFTALRKLSSDWTLSRARRSLSAELDTRLKNPAPC